MNSTLIRHDTLMAGLIAKSAAAADAAAKPTVAQAAIASADAYLNNAVLPTYSELLAALRDAAEYVSRFAELNEEPEGGDCDQVAQRAHGLVLRHDRTMAGDFRG